MLYLLYPGPTHVRTYCLAVVPLSTFASNPLLFLLILVIYAYLHYFLHVSILVPRPIPCPHTRMLTTHFSTYVVHQSFTRTCYLRIRAYLSFYVHVYLLVVLLCLNLYLLSCYYLISHSAYNPLLYMYSDSSVFVFAVIFFTCMLLLVSRITILHVIYVVVFVVYSNFAVLP
jgi:hypothetical protein